jgi:hypothetical protein
VRLALLVVAACGRVGFDAVGSPSDGAADVAGAPDASPVPPGAKIWLQMSTDPSVAIVDSAGGHICSCSGTCPAAATGKHGGGFAFTMQEIVIDNAADLDSSAGFTGAIWVQLTAPPAGLECVWTKAFNNPSSYDTFTLCIDSGGLTTFDSETPTGTSNSDPGPNIAVGEWHHMAMTWDGVTKTDYLDGQVVASHAIVLGSGIEQMALGASRSAYYSQAIVDDALYYTRALTAAEIAQLATP